MRPRALLLLEPSDAGAMAWLRPAGAVPAPWERVRLDAVGGRVRGGAVAVLVPAEALLLTRAQLPPMGAGRLRRALPYALEEHLAEDVERLHFSPGRRDAHGLPVAVVARARRSRWLAALAAAGVRPRCLVPDVLTLPWEPETWSLLLAGDRVLARLGAQAGFAAELTCAEAFLGAALAGAPEDAPRRAVLHAAPGDGAADPVVALLEAAGVTVTRRSEREDARDWLGTGLRRDTAPDLLRGDTPAAPAVARPPLPWVRTAALAAALAVVHFGIVALEHGRALAEAAALDGRIAALYRDVYPGEPVPADPRARMAADLRALAGGAAAERAGLLDLLAGAAVGLAAVDGLELQAVEFRDGRMDLAVRVPSAQALDALERRLAEGARLAVRVLSASAGEGAAEGRLRIRAANGGAG